MSNTTPEKEGDDNQAKENIHEPAICQLFVGGLDNRTTDDSLRAHFQQYGTVVDAAVRLDPQTQRSRGFGCVTFAHSSTVDEVQATRPHQVDERVVETRRAVPRQYFGRPEADAVVTKLFVGGIVADLHEDKDLRDYFGQFGHVTSVNIVQDVVSCYAFVEFDDYDAVDKIMWQQTHIVKNTTLSVRKALSLPEVELDNDNDNWMDADNN